MWPNLRRESGGTLKYWYLNLYEAHTRHQVTEQSPRALIISIIIFVIYNPPPPKKSTKTNEAKKTWKGTNHNWKNIYFSKTENIYMLCRLLYFHGAVIQRTRQHISIFRIVFKSRFDYIIYHLGGLLGSLIDINCCLIIHRLRN